MDTREQSKSVYSFWNTLYYITKFESSMKSLKKRFDYDVTHDNVIELRLKFPNI